MSDEDGGSWFNLDYWGRKLNNIGAGTGNLFRRNIGNRRWRNDVGNVGSSVRLSGNSPMQEAGAGFVRDVGDSDYDGGIQTLAPQTQSVNNLAQPTGDNPISNSIPQPINGTCPIGWTYIPATSAGYLGIDLPEMCIDMSGAAYPGGNDSDAGPGADPLDPDTEPDEFDPAVGKYPDLKTGQEVYLHILREKNSEGLTLAQVSKAQEYGKSLPDQSKIPDFLKDLLGLRFGGNMSEGPSFGLGDVDLAGQASSLQVLNDKTNFMKYAPSALQQMDSRYYNSKSFVPEGEQRNFNTQYRSIPGQEYGNYNAAKDREKPTFAEGGLMSLAGGGSASYPRVNGQIEGPGTEKSDDIPAMLSDGEFVVNAAAVRGIGNLMGKKKPKSKMDQRREGARTMYALQKAGERSARMS